MQLTSFRVRSFLPGGTGAAACASRCPNSQSRVLVFCFRDLGLWVSTSGLDS